MTDTSMLHRNAVDGWGQGKPDNWRRKKHAYIITGNVWGWTGESGEVGKPQEVPKWEDYQCHCSWQKFNEQMKDNETPVQHFAHFLATIPGLQEYQAASTVVFFSTLYIHLEDPRDKPRIEPHKDPGCLVWYWGWKNYLPSSFEIITIHDGNPDPPVYWGSCTLWPNKGGVIYFSDSKTCESQIG